MKTYTIPESNIDVSRIAYGCMKLGRHWDANPITKSDIKEGQKVIHTALELGINLFDHADIYTRGKSEQVFGEILSSAPSLREKMVIQSKCSIRFAGEPSQDSPQRYDFSYDHIINSVEGSLRRLNTEFLDILLLHRPDPLVRPAEVARAFNHLHTTGKVRVFGVSNHTGAQIALLQSEVDQHIAVNQIKLNLIHAYLIDEGVDANRSDANVVLSSGTLEYCRLNNVLLQAYGPVAGGELIHPRPDVEKRVKSTASLINHIAQKHNSSREAVALAWLLHHPADIQPIIGTTRPERVKKSCLADSLQLSREEWYSLYIAGRGRPLP